MKKQLQILLFSTALFGCSTSQQALLPVGETTMKDIWAQSGGHQQHFLATTRTTLPTSSTEPRLATGTENVQYTRNASNEAMNLFPRLPNPDLVMYVFPHLTLSTEPVPVPGYSTVFPFYGRVQYAQPGERTRDY